MSELTGAHKETADPVTRSAADAASLSLTGIASGRADLELFRTALKQSGIDPDASMKTLIGVYEPAQRLLEEPTPGHTKEVAGTIGDATFGFFRNANIKLITDGEKPLNPSAYVNKPDGLKRLVSDFGVGAMDSLSTTIKSQVINGDVKVLNVSQAYTGQVLANDLRFVLGQDAHKYSGFIKQVLGDDKGQQLINELDEPAVRLNDLKFSDKTDALDAKLYDFVEGTLDKDAAFKTATHKYLDLTKQAADRGRYIVVAAGNYNFPGYSNPEAAYSWYARSDNVISIGGDVWNRPASDPSTHAMFVFSSPGSEKFHPTVVANSWSPVSGYIGTSFATPRGSGTVAEMLDQNPKLSFRMTKFILEATAQPLPGVGTNFQGAGDMHPDLAIQTAKQSRDASNR